MNAPTRQKAAEPQTALFTAEMLQVPDLKRIIRTIQEIVTEATVTVSDDGMRLVAADPSMVGMVNLLLKPAMFEQWEPPADPVTFHLNVDTLKKRVCEARKGDTVGFALRPNPPGDAEYLFDVSISNGVETRFAQPTLDLDEVDRPETDLEFSGAATVTADAFCDAVKRMNDTVAFTLRNDRLVMKSEGDDEHRAAVAFTDDTNAIRDIRVDDGAAKSLYSTDYVESVVRLKKAVNRFRVELGTDFPIRVTTDESRFKLAYIIAPRIEED